MDGYKNYDNEMKPRIVSDFFLDGAKIIFGSIVVGAFVKGAVPPGSLLATIGIGIIMTAIFLLIASTFAEREG